MALRSIRTTQAGNDRVTQAGNTRETQPVLSDIIFTALAGILQLETSNAAVTQALIDDTVLG